MWAGPIYASLDTSDVSLSLLEVTPLTAFIADVLAGISTVHAFLMRGAEEAGDIRSILACSFDYLHHDGARSSRRARRNASNRSCLRLENPPQMAH